jgi:hypothetical protein
MLDASYPETVYPDDPFFHPFPDNRSIGGSIRLNPRTGSIAVMSLNQRPQWPKCTRRLSGRFLMSTSHPERLRRIGERRHLARPGANLDQIRPERASRRGTTIELPSSLWETEDRTCTRLGSSASRLIWGTQRFPGQRRHSFSCFHEIGRRIAAFFP